MVAVPIVIMAPRKERTVGYRDYYMRMNGILYRGHTLEGHGYSSIKRIEANSGFVRWIDTEWQYDEVEL